MSGRLTEQTLTDAPELDWLAHAVDPNDTTDDPSGSSFRLTLSTLQDLMIGSTVKIVQQLSDFPTPVAGVITLEAGIIYIVTGIVNILANRFVITNGANLCGYLSSHDGIVYTGTGTFITGGSSVNMFLTNLSFTATSGSSTFVEFTGAGSNTEVMSLNACVVNGFGTLGTITDVNIFAEFRTQFFGFTTGFSFLGTNQGDFFMSSMDHMPGAGTLTVIDFGTSTWGRIVIETAAFDVAAGQTAISGLADSGNFISSGSGSMSLSSFTGAGTYVSGWDNSDIQLRFLGNEGNNGVEDSVNRGAFTMQGNVTATTFLATSTPVKSLGTFKAQGLSRFTFNTDGTLTYIGLETIRVSIMCSLSPTTTAGGNQDINFFVAKNGTVLADFLSAVRIKTGEVKSVTIPAEVTLDTDDTLDLWVENTTSTTSVVVDAVKYIVSGL